MSKTLRQINRRSRVTVDNIEVMGRIYLVSDKLKELKDDTAAAITANSNYASALTACLSNDVYPLIAANSNHASALVAGLSNGLYPLIAADADYAEDLLAALSNNVYPRLAAHCNSLTELAADTAGLSNVLYPLNTFARGITQSVTLTEVIAGERHGPGANYITFPDANLVPSPPPTGSDPNWPNGFPASIQSIGVPTQR